MRTRPYRNDRIIAATRELYFTGRSALASRFVDRFPVSEDGNGVSKREVPIPMVALVATAVSHVCLFT